MVESNAENKWERAFGTASTLHALFKCFERVFLYISYGFFTASFLSPTPIKKKTDVPRSTEINISIRKEMEILGYASHVISANFTINRVKACTRASTRVHEPQIRRSF